MAALAPVVAAAAGPPSTVTLATLADDVELSDEVQAALWAHLDLNPEGAAAVSALARGRPAGGALRAEETASLAILFKTRAS